MNCKVMSYTYQTKKEDLEKWFKFSIEYWLNPKKGKTGRTSGQPRGLGDILDSFMMKIIETGVAKIIEENFCQSKELITDDEIKPNNVIRDDPDIFKIKENDNERDPKVFIEIKYHNANAHWIGPRTKQIEAFETGSSRLNINNNRIYIIGADIINDSSISEDKGKKDSLLGIFLKSSTNLDYFNDFYETLPKIQIRYALRLKDLKDKGTIVGKGDYFLSTTIFEKNKYENFFKDKNLKEQFKIVEYPHWNKENNEITLCLQPEPKKNGNNKVKVPLKNNPIEKYGKFKIIGADIKFILKENELSDRYFILCKEDIKLSNNFFGEYSLKKNNIYSFQLQSMGRDPTIKNENLFISENYLKKLQVNEEIDSIENVLKEIGENA